MLLYNHNDLQASMIPTITEEVDNSSIFLFGLDLIKESDDAIRNMLYGLSEEAYLTENIIDSYKDFRQNFSFIKAIKFIVGLLNKMIFRIFKELYNALLQINYNDRTIKRYSNKLKNYPSALKINFSFYNYSNLDADIPTTDQFFNFQEQYSITIGDLEKLEKQVSSGQELASLIIKKRDDLQNNLNAGFYDYIRKDSIKIFSDRTVVDPIPQDMFQEKLTNLFRGGKITGSDVMLSPEAVASCYERFVSIDKNLEKVKKKMRAIEAESTAMCSKIEKIKPEDFLKNSAYKNDISVALNSYCILKSKQLSEICNIYVLVFTAKMQALKDSAAQDKRVLFDAIRQIIVHGGGES